MNHTKTSFEALIKEQKSTIYAVCYLFSKDADEVNDLFQEALINLWKGYAAFEGRSDLKTWIYRVCMNTCISFHRKEKRHTHLPIENEGQTVTPFSESRDSQIRMLHQRIHHLQPFDRAIVLLWLEDMSYEEIGAIVGISPKNVSVRLYRIKEKLKNLPND